MKITARIRTAKGIQEIELPQNNKNFNKTLDDANILKPSDYAIENVRCENELIGLFLDEGKDIEELNYFAQKLDSFTSNEMDRYIAVINAKQDVLGLRELINTAEVINEYDFNKDVHDLTELGEDYVYQHARDIDPVILEYVDHEGLGASIKDNLCGEFTEMGYCENIFEKFEERYDGKFLPDFIYDVPVLRVRLSANENPQTGVYMDLPATQGTINRALKRLEVNSLKDCKIIDYNSMIFYRIERIFGQTEDLNKLNRLSELLEKIPENRQEAFDKMLKSDSLLTKIDDVIDFTTDFVQRGIDHAQQTMAENKQEIANSQEMNEGSQMMM